MGEIQANVEAAGGLDRRTFLRGAALAGAAAVAAGALGACSPASPSGTPEASAADGADKPAADAAAAPGAAPKGTVGGAICPEDWLGEMPVVVADEIVETKDFDVVVLGAGHAGCQAALAAAEEGVSVAVVEVQPEDTYSTNGDDIATYNSKFVISQGYGPYDLGEVTAEYVRRGNGRVNAEVIKAFVDNSGEMLDNMIDNYIPETSTMFDKLGETFVIQHAYGKEDGSYYPLTISGFKNWATSIQTAGTKNPTPVLGREGVSRLTEFDLYALEGAKGKGAEIFWNTSTYSLVMDGDAVAGAIVKGPDGFIQLNAKKGVILCTGDFSSNTDMVYNLLDEVAEFGTLAGADRAELGGFGRDGMGHKLACWAGGAMEPHPRPTMDGGMPGAWGTTPYLFLNSQGNRFMNEAMAQMIGETFLRCTPPGNINIITDSKFMQAIEQVGCDHGAPNWGNPAQVYAMQEAVEAMVPGPEGAIIPSTDVVKLDGGEKEDFGGSGGGGHEPKPNCFAANTLDELLGYLGYEGETKANALAAIERYNELCASGVDTDFGKDAQYLIPIDTPLFYASFDDNKKTPRAGLVTLAGVPCDRTLNVLKADRTGTIKGLYAAGNVLGERYGNGYATPSAGNSIGMAMTHGRVAGKNAAAR